MREPSELKVPRWPFFVGDAILLGAAYFIYRQSQLPMGAWPMGFVVICVAGGAVLGVLPFLLEYRLQVKLAELRELGRAADQLKNLEAVAARIDSATNRWNTVHEEAEKVAATARSIADRMGHEMQSFTQFMEKVNDGEKATLRLEVDKLRRAEGDWVQVLVRMLDHVFALHFGAVQSGQPRLIEQLTNFQNACREAARRVGLVPFVAAPADTFDGQRHQVVEGEAPAAPGATVAETVAAGYTFQGRLLRPALVRLECESVAGESTPRPTQPEPPTDAAQSRLALEQS